MRKFNDWEREDAIHLSIAQLDCSQMAPAPYSPEQGARELRRCGELVRGQMEGADAKLQGSGRPAWTADSRARLERVPNFVRGMVMKIYNEWAMERGIIEITPAVMDEARVDLGLEEM